MSIFLYIKNKALHLYNKVKQVKPIDNDNGNGGWKKTNSVQAQRKFVGKTERTGRNGRTEPQ